MANRLVITIHPDGAVETLLKDKVFDSRVLGDRRIERLSEVLPTDDGQKFFVRWLLGPLAASNEVKVGNLAWFANNGIACWPDGETVYSNSYEEAVELEVAYVNAMRKAGISFAGVQEPAT
jgi:hypothetical protein